MDQKRTGATLDWTTEDEYWRTHYKHRPYFDSAHEYDQWQPAYRYGYDSARRYQDKKWEDIESDLRTGWDRYEHRGAIRRTWEEVKGAVRDAWDRVFGNR